MKPWVRLTSFTLKFIYRAILFRGGTRVAAFDIGPAIRGGAISDFSFLRFDDTQVLVLVPCYSRGNIPVTFLLQVPCKLSLLGCAYSCTSLKPFCYLYLITQKSTRTEQLLQVVLPRGFIIGPELPVR
jgi:hypothetical protein